MKKYTQQFLTTAALSVALSVLPVMAHEHDDDEGDSAQHFAAKAAPDVNTALCNLAEFNAILNDVTAAQSLDPVAMVKVHELTYTLENALARLDKTLEATAVALEEVHLASERMDEAVVKTQSQKYFALLASLSGQCQ
jgi:hypothetical protein